jgi:hypothetical protein
MRKATYLLQLLRVRDDLNDPVPNLLADMVSRRSHQRQDRVHIPLVVRRELLGEDSDFEDHLLAKGVVGNDEVLQELANDRFRVARITHRVEEVESATANRDVLVAERLSDRSLVLLDRFEVVAASGEMGHRVETEVADVRLLRKDEATKKVGCLLNNDRFSVKVNGEVDRFEEDGVLSVVLLNILVLIARVLEDALEDVVEDKPESGVVCETRGLAKNKEAGGMKRTGRRVVLQQTEKLDLKPRCRDLVVDVVGGVLALEDELSEGPVRKYCVDERKEDTPC